MNLLLEYIQHIIEAESDKTVERLDKIFVVEPDKQTDTTTGKSTGGAKARNALASYVKGKPYPMKSFIEPQNVDQSKIRFDEPLVRKIFSNLAARLGDPERRGLQKLLKDIESDALPSKSRVQNKSSKDTKSTVPSK